MELSERHFDQRMSELALAIRDSQEKELSVNLEDSLNARTIEQLSNREIEELKALIDERNKTKKLLVNFSKDRMKREDGSVDLAVCGIYEELGRMELIKIGYGLDDHALSCTFVQSRGYWAVERYDMMKEEEDKRIKSLEERYRTDRRTMLFSSLAGAVVGALIAIVAKIAIG